MNPIDPDSFMDPTNPINPMNSTNPTNPNGEMQQQSFLEKGNPGDKVVPIKPKSQKNQINKKNQITQRNTKTRASKTQKRASIPKQPHKKGIGQ